MREGDDYVTRHDLSSLRLLGSVGEPINPEAWRWYHQIVGKERIPIVDTWWQTETGGIMITTLPGAHAMQPGSAGRPFFGVRPQLVAAEGGVLADERSEEHTSELQSIMRISYAVFHLKKKKQPSLTTSALNK